MTMISVLCSETSLHDRNFANSKTKKVFITGVAAILQDCLHNTTIIKVNSSSININFRVPCKITLVTIFTCIRIIFYKALKKCISFITTVLCNEGATFTRLDTGIHNIVAEGVTTKFASYILCLLRQRDIGCVHTLPLHECSLHL